MVFGGQCYDPSNPGDALALGALGLVASRDDPVRRRKLTGKRLMKYKLGGAAISEAQMPLGWHQKKDKHGRKLIDGGKGIVPEADPSLIPVMKALYEAHAAGETYQQIAQHMITFETEGLLSRRDHKDPDNTYAATADDQHARYDTAKSLFVRTNMRPAEAPTEAAIDAYLAGASPEAVFDADTRLFITKIELVRTGRYFRRLKNDIRGRNTVLDGIPAQYRDDLDEFGWFDVLSEPWAWPVDATGTELPSFGVSDETCRRVAARLLRELRAPRSATGGRSHRQATRRAIQRFDNWFVPAGSPSAVYEDEPTEWGVEARQNNSSKANFVLLHRKESAATGRRRGWSNLGPGEEKPDHIAATGSLDDLCASVAWQLDRAVRTLLGAEQLATLSEVRAPDYTGDPTMGWQTKVDLRKAEIERLETEARGHRSMAALKAGQGNLAEAEAYATQAESTMDTVKHLAGEVTVLLKKIDDHGKLQSSPARPDLANISVAAFLVAGLERASKENGDAPARVGLVADETFTEWRFTAREDDLEWSCIALVPLASGSAARLPLSGVIRNVRTRPGGKALAGTATVVRYLFEEGRDLSDVTTILGATRKTLLTKRVMPWLVEHGITSRGGKCALVDHPLSSVRRDLYDALTIDTPPTQLSPYRTRLRNTYLDPDLQWGDAAVPDDTTRIARAVELLTANSVTKRDGLPVLDLALELGCAEKEVRRFVKPQRRSGGFTRPQFLTYADPEKTRVRAISCPHKGCKGRRYANHVVMLPEVTASGFGVICSHCRRVPSALDDWPTVQFPAEYLRLWTSRGPNGSLRAESQTVEVTSNATLAHAA